MEKVLRKAKISEVIKYGFGGIASNMSYGLITTYLMFFYTDKVGINAAAVGGLFLIARFIDAFSDTIIGMLTDRTKSKLGKFRPWIMYGSPFLGLLTIALFTTPNLSPGSKLIYAYVTYIAFSLVSAAVNIPYHSLTPVLTEDTNQRTVIATTKQIMGILGTSFVTICAMPIVISLGSGADAWQKFAVITAVLTTIAFYICAWGAKEHDKMEIHTSNSGGHEMSIKDQVQLIIKNKALLMLMIAFAADMLALTAAGAVNMYYFIYALKRPDLIAVVASYGLFIGGPTVFLVPFFCKKFGKKMVFIVSSTILMFLSVALYFIPFTSVNLILIQSALYAAISPFTGVVGFAILADCVEYGEWVTGKRGAGTVSSQLIFVNKLGMALGGLLAGVAISAVGYVAGAADQAPSTLKAFVGLKALLPAGGYLISIIAMSFYPITKEFYTKMVNENAQRRAAKAEK